MPLVLDNIRALQAAEAVISGLSPEGYAGPGVIIGSVGVHFRHVLDHYTALIEGAARGEVEYERRARDPRLERDRDFALASARAHAQALDELRGVPRLRLRLRAGPDASIDLGSHESTLERELHFVLLHSTHHFALIAAELGLRGVAVPKQFGVAPATIGWRQASA